MQGETLFCLQSCSDCCYIVKVWDPRTVRNSQCDPVGIFAGHKDGISHVESKVLDRKVG